LWEYAQQSARLIFEGASEDPNQTRVVDLLKARSLTQTQLNDAFAGHLRSAELNAILEELQARGVIQAVKEKTSGRPVTTWSLISQGAGKAEKAEEQAASATCRAKSAYSAGGDA